MQKQTYFFNQFRITCVFYQSYFCSSQHVIITVSVYNSVDVHVVDTNLQPDQTEKNWSCLSREKKNAEMNVNQNQKDFSDGSLVLQLTLNAFMFQESLKAKEGKEPAKMPNSTTRQDVIRSSDFNFLTVLGKGSFGKVMSFSNSWSRTEVEKCCSIAVALSPLGDFHTNQPFHVQLVSFCVCLLSSSPGFTDRMNFHSESLFRPHHRSYKHDQ